MLHCYKIEFNFLQKKFSKHLLHNIIVAYAYIVKQNVSRVPLLYSFKRCYNAKKKKKSDNTLHRRAGIRVL